MNRKTAWDKYLQDARNLDLSSTPVPDGWHLAVGELGVSTAWLESGGHDGGRCLWITPKGGGASWYCDPIPVSGGAEYLFRCWMKRDGNRHWAHACAVSWVSLVFQDASGAPCRQDPENDQPLALIRCRKTADWVEATRYLKAPPEAVSLVIGFRIERGEPAMDDAYGFRRFWHGDIDTGQWWIDGVRLERMPLEAKSGEGQLSIRIPEGAARLRVTDASGKTYAPPGAAAYEKGGGCFHALRDVAEWALPPGRYTVEAMRGFERKPFRTEVEITAGGAATVEAELPRTVDWPARGWYMGDHHNHLSFHGDTRHPAMSIDDVCRIARGEGLDYLSFCGELVDQHAYADWRDAGRPADAKPDGAFETPDFRCCVSHEVTQDLLGHVCLVNAPGHVAPGHPWWITPTNAALFKGLRRDDALGTHGAMVMAHPYDALNEENLFDVLADPSVTCLQRELPVDAALGLADTMDFLVADPPTNLAMRFRDYFRLLNLGLRIGVSASSDAYADQGTDIVGSVRTVVLAEAFTMDDIAMAYRRQRTMATNGPLVEFTVNGAGPGDTVAGPALRIDARAFSQWGIERIEVVSGGEVVAEATPREDGWAYIETELQAERCQWLVARAYGPGHPALNVEFVPPKERASRGQCCVTSPVYVEMPGKPIVPKPEDAAYFVHWIDASCEAIRKRRALIEGQGPYGPQMTDEHVQTARDLFARTRQVYEKMM